MNLYFTPRGSYICEDDPGEPGYGGSKRLSVTLEEAHLLAHEVAGLDVLEIGTGLGVSTRALASTAHQVYTVDIDPWVQAEVWPGLRDLTNVRCFQEIPDLPVSAVFIDGCHFEEAAAQDARTALRLLGGHGKIIWHDATNPNVQVGLGQVLPLAQATIHPTTWGVGVLCL